MGNFLLTRKNDRTKETALQTAQEGTARRVGPSRRGQARNPHLPVLRAEVQVERLGQPHVSALPRSPVARFLRDRGAHPQDPDAALARALAGRRYDDLGPLADIRFLLAFGDPLDPFERGCAPVAISVAKGDTAA